MRQRDNNVGQDIRTLVARCDVCIVDLDQCIYPRFTQTALGRMLLARSFTKSHRGFAAQLLRGAAYIIVTRLSQAAGKKPFNHELMAAFCRTIRGMPIAVIEELVHRLPDTGPRDWKDALELIASRMSVFLLSFSIESIVRAYGETTGAGGKRIFRFVRGTPVTVSNGRVAGCIFSAASLSPEAKLRAMEEVVGKEGFRHPLIIGHGKDEAEMAQRARRMGGGSIGFVKASGDVSSFDIKLRGNAWIKIANALKSG